VSDCQQWIEAAVAHQRRAEGAEHDLAAARAEIATLTAERDGARTDMTRLQEVIGTAAKDMVDAKAEIAALRSRVAQKDEALELLYANLADHQGCGMSLELTQALMKTCKAALSSPPAEERESGT
jgi:chromosome segregation ATPase